MKIISKLRQTKKVEIAGNNLAILLYFC